MKLTKPKLKEIHIFNPHNFCTVGGGRIYVGYSPRDPGRCGHAPCWRVVGVREETYPEGPRYNRGHKTFICIVLAGKTRQEAKEAARLDAIAWATEKYGITDWVKDPFGDYQSAAVMKRVIEKLNAKE